MAEGTMKQQKTGKFQPAPQPPSHTKSTTRDFLEQLPQKSQVFILSETYRLIVLEAIHKQEITIGGDDGILEPPQPPSGRFKDFCQAFEAFRIDSAKQMYIPHVLPAWDVRRVRRVQEYLPAIPFGCIHAMTASREIYFANTDVLYAFAQHFLKSKAAEKLPRDMEIRMRIQAISAQQHEGGEKTTTDFDDEQEEILQVSLKACYKVRDTFRQMDTHAQAWGFTFEATFIFPLSADALVNLWMLQWFFTFAEGLPSSVSGIQIWDEEHRALFWTFEIGEKRGVAWNRRRIGVQQCGIQGRDDVWFEKVDGKVREKAKVGRAGKF